MALEPELLFIVEKEDLFEIDGGSSFASQNSTIAHFGLVLCQV
jgi:hypothetical protein